MRGKRSAQNIQGDNKVESILVFIHESRQHDAPPAVVICEILGKLDLD